MKIQKPIKNFIDKYGNKYYYIEDSKCTYYPVCIPNSFWSFNTKVPTAIFEKIYIPGLLHNINGPAVILNNTRKFLSFHYYYKGNLLKSHDELIGKIFEDTLLGRLV